MDRDFSRSRAILISNAVFTDTEIEDLPGAAGSASAMKALLTSELCGWPENRVETLTDVVAPEALATALIELTEGVEDVLLLYYVGHGIRMTTGQLALALRGTSSNRALLRHTAMAYKDVAEILRGCPATTKLVILDCSYAELGRRGE
jgi:Caspase domain